MFEDKLYIYTRVSTTDQKDEGYSLDYQKDLGIQKSIDLKIDYEVFDEGDKSGSTEDIFFNDRPVLKNLMEKVREGLVKRIYVYELTRLSRVDHISSLLNYDFKKYGVIIYTNTGEYNLNNPVDNMISKIVSSVSQFENQTRSIRSKLGLKKSVEKGKWIGSFLPYGYTKDKNGIVIPEEDEKQVYLKMVEMSLRGLGSNIISTELNLLGIKTRGNKILKKNLKRKKKYTNERIEIPPNQIKWRPGTVYRILRNPIYKGQRIYKGYPIFNITPLIDEKTWDKVQESLKTRKLFSTKNNKVHFYLLKGLLRCGRCGGNLYGKIKEKKKERVYICSGKRREMSIPGGSICSLRSPNLDKLNNLVWDVITKTENDSYLMREEFKKKVQSSKNNSNSRKKIQSEISYNKRLVKDKEVEIERVLTLYQKGKLDEEVWEQRNNKIKSEINYTLKKIKDFDLQLDMLDGGNKWINWLDEFKNNVKNMVKYTPEQKRNFLRSRVKNIVVDYLPNQRIHKIKIELHEPIFNDIFSKKTKSQIKKGDWYSVEKGNSEKEFLLDGTEISDFKRFLGENHLLQHSKRQHYIVKGGASTPQITIIIYIYVSSDVYTPNYFIEKVSLDFY